MQSRTRISPRIRWRFSSASYPQQLGSVIFDDHFDSGVTGEWISQGNARTASHNITSTDSVLQSEVISTQTNSNRGVASAASIDPVGEGGFAVTFVVDSLGQSPEVNGFFLGLVGDNSVFYRDGSTRNSV